MDPDKYLRPEEVSERWGFSKSHLAQLRFNGNGPRYSAPTPRKILYKESDVIAWFEANARQQTGDPIAS